MLPKDALVMLSAEMSCDVVQTRARVIWAPFGGAFVVAVFAAALAPERVDRIANLIMSVSRWKADEFAVSWEIARRENKATPA
jgi:hypothetical protein